MKHHTWIVVSLVGLALVLGLLVLNINRRADMLVETGETRRSVEASLEQLLPETITSAGDEALLSAVRSLSGAPYVARLILVEASGRIVFQHQAPVKTGDEVSAAAGRDARSLVAGLPVDEFSADQAVQLYTAAALMADGDHNDVFRPLVRPLRSPEGQVIGFVGIAYDVSTAVGSPTMGDVRLVLLSLAGLGLYWLALPVWTFFDARLRGEPGWLWSAFVLAANLVGLVAYLLAVSRGRRAA